MINSIPPLTQKTLLFSSPLSPQRYQQAADSLSSSGAEKSNCCTKGLTFLGSALLAIVLLPYYLVKKILNFCCSCGKSNPVPVEEETPVRSPAKMYAEIERVTGGNGKEETRFETVTGGSQTIAAAFEKEGRSPLVIKNSIQQLPLVFPEFGNKLPNFMEKTDSALYVNDQTGTASLLESPKFTLYSHSGDLRASPDDSFIFNGSIYKGVKGEHFQALRAKIDLQLQAAFEQKHKVLIIEVTNLHFDLKEAVYRAEIQNKFPGCFQQVTFVKMPAVESAQAPAGKNRRVTTLADLKNHR